MSDKTYAWETNEEKQALIEELMKKYDEPEKFDEEELYELDPDNTWYGLPIIGDKTTHNK